jgi:undecaprenyl-diphosphatase
MSLLQALALGIAQGLTEFIPVSSTAHLILIPWLLGWRFDSKVAFVFDVLLQLGTLAAVIAYFWTDLFRIGSAAIRAAARGRPFESADARLGWYVLLATVPAVAVGYVFKRFFEGLHGNPAAVAGILASGAALLLVSERLGQRTRPMEGIQWQDALFVGCAQSLALLPGVSRSAATICGGLLRDLERPAAARFSFLMSIPVLMGAGAVAVRDLLLLPDWTHHLPSLAVGFLVSVVVGFLSIHWLLGYLARRPLDLFAWYRVAAGVWCLGRWLSRAP